MKQIQMFTVKDANDELEFYLNRSKQAFYRALHAHSEVVLAHINRQTINSNQERNPPC